MITEKYLKDCGCFDNVIKRFISSKIKLDGVKAIDSYDRQFSVDMKHILSKSNCHIIDSIKCIDSKGNWSQFTYKDSKLIRFEMSSGYWWIGDALPFMPYENDVPDFCTEYKEKIILS
jgi:hypothetical protein|tara:strand:- start:22220 stop:22573 length:354 start_codon:yes stop_codon:yes gene_type:complete